MGLVWPLFAGLYFILKGIHWTLLAWWRTHGFKKERIRRRGDDVKRNLYFLYSQGTPIKEKRTRVLPFDYASVYIANGKIQFCFTRGRGELNVSLSPRHAPDDAYELAVVVAALDSKDITKLAQLNDLASVGDLLRARLDELNHVFSESSYSEFKRKLLKVKENVRILTREAEWELNRGLYR